MRLGYGTEKDKLSSKIDPVPTTLAKNNTGWVLLESLSPDTRYYYAVVADDGTPVSERSGSFRTLPEPDQFRTVGRNTKGLFNCSFEIGCGNLLKEGCCADPRLGQFDVALKQLEDIIHFAFQTGDFIYEDNEARLFTPKQIVKALRRKDIKWNGLRTKTTLKAAIDIH